MPRQIHVDPVPPSGDCPADPPSANFQSAGTISGATPEPELKLMAMILEDAISCYLRYRDAKSATGRRECRAAERWLSSRDRQWIFSFENICQHLGADPEFVRGQIRARRSQESAGRRRRQPDLEHGGSSSRSTD